MSRRSRQKSARLEVFNSVTSEIEDQILDAYGELTVENPDLYLHQVPELFHQLKIPECFTDDITQAIGFYYEVMQKKGFEVDEKSHKQHITIQLLRHFTITNASDFPNNIIDIVDIDKLIRGTNRLVKFRDNYSHIYSSWMLFIDATDMKDKHQDPVGQRLTLPALRTIKTTLGLDEQELCDSFLIDMLGCCSTDIGGEIMNYDFEKLKLGTSVSIKDFAEILGNLGEYD